MAVISNSYGTLHVISPYYINIEKDLALSDSIIITDVVNLNEPGELDIEATGDVIWLRIRAGEVPEELSTEPVDKEAVHTDVEKLDQLRLLLTSDELFLIQYSNSAKNDATQRQSVTGFELTTNDIIYLKIDTVNDVLQIYQEI